MFKKVKNSKTFKWISNKYLLVLVAFAVWMLFFDANSFLVHNQLNKEIKELENNREYFQNEISNDNLFLESLKDSGEMEKYARETYYFKKENEDIFIIEYEDSINNPKK